MSFGLLYNAARILLPVLALAKHKIKIGYGTPGNAYGNKDIPISGFWQRNGLGSALWVLISTRYNMYSSDLPLPLLTTLIYLIVLMA
jgi:hypothetical protein